MHRPDVSSTNYWLGNCRPSLSSPWLDNNILNTPPGLGLPTGRFHPEASRPEPEVNRSQATVSASGLSSPRLCDRANSSPQAPSSTVEFGPPDTETSTRRKVPPGGFASYESDCNLLERCSPDMDPDIYGLPDSDGNVSSSTPDEAYFVRCRSVSLGAAWASSSSTRGGIDPFKSESDPDVSGYSILESILLNRNVPPFYSSVGCGDGHRPGVADSPDEFRAACGDDFAYKRPRLHSMPLPSSIPSTGRSVLGVGHSDQCSDYEPACLAFRRRKVSLESHRTAPENEISSQKIAAANNGFRQFKSPKFQRKRSILHSLLTFESKLGRQSDDDDDDHPENGDVTRRQSSEPEVDECIDRTSCHVDSTESLPPTLEKLVLEGGGGGGDRSSRLQTEGIVTRQQRVAIAKKMAPVVNRKVAKWLTEIAQLAARYRDLAGLPREDWIVLLRNAVSRLLLLFMAENNFQFAVAPVVATDRRRTASDGEGHECSPAVSPAEIPTAGSVEDIQRFIAKCQALKVDGREYQCMRLITLFHSGCTAGLRRIAMVDHIKSGACKILQNLVRQSRPNDKLRYGDLLLHLHSLASVNSRMVQRLFNISPSEDSHAQPNEWQWLKPDDA